ncbi:MAG: hypothetical protein SPF80_07485 [Candidatus Cryptobacteroides sp.]|nr:hypothetical protein [Bacteroidales bacterium]MDY5495838.1 hypothetical protein [Candidatus Cryptobacteroides sp.]
MILFIKRFVLRLKCRSGNHVGNTLGIGEFRIISHDFNDGVWRVRWKVIAKQ